MADRHMCVLIYAGHEQVAKAVAILQASGHDMDHLSVMARDDWGTAQKVGAFRLGDSFAYGGAHAEFWHSTWDSMPGKGGVWLFGEGPLLLAGRIARAMAAGARGVDSLPEDETLHGLLARIGIPVRDIPRYEIELRDYRLLLFVEGDLEGVDQAQRSLEGTKPINNTIHHDGAAH